MSTTAPVSSGWMFWVLRAAGVYNVLWGVWTVLFPKHLWQLMSIEVPSHLFLWQCIGMIVGVYGVGYWVAARDPLTHWPIVLVGLLGKIFGPIGFVQTAFIEQQLPLRFGLTILTNDLAWWVPFTLILARAYARSAYERARLWSGRGDSGPGAGRERAGTSEASIDAAKDQRGKSLRELSGDRMALVVFLRHGGCTFCREALADLSRQRQAIEQAGARIVLVHMDRDDAVAERRFGAYALADVSRISDPERTLYRAFELRRGTLEQLFGLRVWLRGFIAGIVDRHGIGALAGDGFQMPGAFLVRDGKVLLAYRHQDAADRPAYAEMCAVPSSMAS
ncbi:MAG: peroxiredoxin-like family protein [Planctomycetota bacterium]|nr:peroxiredoxin-like family protein [Planctomycetota bacterium]